MATAAELKIAQQRLADVRAELKRRSLHALVVNNTTNLRYLFNYSGSMAMAVITRKDVHFITNDLYAVQVQTELYKVDGLKIHIDRNFLGVVKGLKIGAAGKKVGFDAGRTTVTSHVAMKKAFAPSTLVDAAGIIETITRVKAPHEIKAIQKAADIASRTYEAMLSTVQAGMTERQVANIIASVSRELGSEKDAFDIICVAGKRSAMPHGRASDAVIKKGDVVTVDFGCVVDGFNSDMTRTFAVGTPSSKVVEVFAVLFDAHMHALDAAVAGVNAAALDAAARDIITAAGYGEYFRHSLGHGLGIDVHENPRVASVNTEETIPNNCVITIEPGIYLPGKFGMRIEDDIVVTTKGANILTSAPRELVIA